MPCVRDNNLSVGLLVFTVTYGKAPGIGRCLETLIPEVAIGLESTLVVLGLVFRSLIHSATQAPYYLMFVNKCVVWKALITINIKDS